MTIREAMADDIEENVPEVRVPPAAARTVLEVILALVVIVLALPAEAVATIALAGDAVVVVTAEELNSDDEQN